MKCNYCKTNEARPSSAYCEECAPDGAPRNGASHADSVRSSAWVAAAELEKAWREGYDAGYDHGSDDAAAYKWGAARGPKTKARNKDDEWDGSETKAATAKLCDGAEKTP